jgi:hypothetical protein
MAACEMLWLELDEEDPRSSWRAKQTSCKRRKWLRPCDRQVNSRDGKHAGFDLAEEGGFMADMKRYRTGWIS